MKLSENFHQSQQNSEVRLPKIEYRESDRQAQNQKYNQFEPFKLSQIEVNSEYRNKSSVTIPSEDSSINIISNLLKERPIYNKIYSKITLSKDKKRQNFKLTANEIIKNYQNDESLYKRGNCPAREVKMNLLVTETDKSDSLPLPYKSSKFDLMKIEYDLFNNRKNHKLKNEKTTKINPKIANLLVHSPGEWKKGRNCSLRYLHNINKKSISEVTKLLRNIDGKVKDTFDKYKKTAEKDFDDII